MKPFITLFLAFTFSFINNSNAQTWAWASCLRGGSEGMLTCTDNKGNVFGAGYNAFTSATTIFAGSDSVTISDGWVLTKYDSSGNLVWLNGMDSAGIIGLATDVAGNLYVLGSYLSSFAKFGNTTLYMPANTATEYFLLKYTPSGVVDFAKNIADVGSQNILAIGNGIGGIAVNGFDVYVTGSYISDSITLGATVLHNVSHAGVFNDVFVAKADSAGNFLWAKTAGGDYIDIPDAIAVTASGHVYVYGYYRSAIFNIGSTVLNNNTDSAHLNTFLLKFDDMGNLSWARSMLHTGVSDYGAVATDTNENVYVTGNFDTSFVLGSNHLGYGGSLTSSFLAKIDSANNIVWANKIADSSTCYGICADPCGDVWLSGSIRFFDTSNHSRHYVIDGHGQLVPAGSYDPMFMGAWGASGSYLQSEILPTGGDDKNDITCDKRGHVYICGDYYKHSFTFGTITLPPDVNEDMFIAQYSPNLCHLLSVPKEEKGNDVSIFPNPAHESFTINYPGSLSGYVSVQLYNMLGQLVYTSQLVSNNTSIATGSLSDGMYICKLIVQGEGIITKKIQVEK